MINKSNDIAISVIMTVKNGERFLRTSLMSVVNQSLVPLEIIVVDDGSADGTWDILCNLKDDFPLINPILTGGIGRSKALNLAISLAKGGWIANIDADDIWHKDKLSLQRHVVSLTDSVTLVSTNTCLFYDDGTPSFNEIVIDEAASPLSRTEIYNYNFVKTNPINHSSVLYNKSSILRVGGYNESLKRLVDIDLWLRLISSNQRIILLNYALTGKRIHSNQSFEASHDMLTRASYSYQLFKMNLRFVCVNRFGPMSYFIISCRFFYHLLPKMMKSIFWKFLR